MDGLFCCPCCKGRLLKEERRYFCEKGHSFDLSKSGYVNLLTGKSGGVHGDNKEMIRARRDFLGEGHYLPLREALCGLLEGIDPKTLLDVGCGEGWYTEGICEALPKTAVYGIDISRDALAFAGKRLRGQAELAVASAYDLPFKEERFDALTLLFSPFAEEEIWRVLKREGVLLMAIPGKRHLWQLKSVLYDTPYENAVSDFNLAGFDLFAKEHITFEKTFGSDTLKNLFAMTPYYYRTPREGILRAFQTKELTVVMEFHLLAYRKVN